MKLMSPHDIYGRDTSPNSTILIAKMYKAINSSYLSFNTFCQFYSNLHKRRIWRFTSAFRTLHPEKFHTTSKFKLSVDAYPSLQINKLTWKFAKIQGCRDTWETKWKSLQKNCSVFISVSSTFLSDSKLLSLQDPLASTAKMAKILW